MSKKVLACLLFCTLSLAGTVQKGFSQNTEAMWQITLPGSPLGIPQPASYGFVALSEPRTFSTITESGVLLNQFFLRKNLSDQYLVLPSDHVCLIMGDYRTVALYNPDGVLLWETVLPFTSAYQPFYLDNGVIICTGSTQIASLSWNGSLLWQMDLPAPCTGQPLLTPWGLFAIPCRSENGTVLELVSPYGIQVSEVSFPANLLSCVAGKDALFVLDSDGTISCLTVTSSGIRTKWHISSPVNARSACLIATGSRLLLISGNGQMTAFRLSDGVETGSDTLWNTTLDSLQLISQGNYSVIAGNTVARTMVYVLNDTGKTVWMKNLDSTDPVFLTQTGLLCQYSDDWSVRSWKTPVHQKSVLTSVSRTCIDLWGARGVPEDSLALIEVLDRLSSRALSSSAVTAQQQYGELGTLIQNNLKDIKTSAYTGYDFSTWYARIIQNETDTAILKQTIVAAGAAPYDSSRQVLNALEMRLKNNRAGVFDDSLCFETCNTVYNICLFMGTPAVIHQGQRILRQLIQPLYSTKVQMTTMETIQKLIDLQKDTQK